MAKPFVHALSSSKRFGGSPSSYQEIHQWFDATKGSFPDNRHRALRHHAEGIFLAEQIFGDETGCITVQLDSGKTKKVSVRDIGEQHVLEDMHFIPTAADYLSEMEAQPWMSGVRGHYPPSARKLRSAKQARENACEETETADLQLKD
jgi:hypothetical protein